MKVRKWLPCLLSAAIAFMLAVSAVGNLITGYGLPVHLWKIFLMSALTALTSAVLFQFRDNKKVILRAAAAVLAGILVKELFRPYIWRQLQNLSFLITSHYHAIYNWPVLGKPGTDHVTGPLMFWAMLVAVCVNWHICRRKHIAVAIVPAVIPLALSLMTAAKVPATAYLYLLILGLAVLLITDWTRKKQPEQGTKLLLWSVAPVALALALLFACNPKAGYINHAGRIQKEVVVRLEDLWEIVEAVISGAPIPSPSEQNRNLLTVGPRSKSSRSVMLVNSPIDGILYLREQDFDVYTGIGWEGTDRKETFTTGAKSSGELTIVTYGVRDVLFVPYYATQAINLVGGNVKNNKNIQQYSYGLSSILVKKTALPNDSYKDLPGETWGWATELVREITAGAKNDREKVARIQTYVRKAAEYDRATAKMSSDYTDFAKWFLEESETGHCVHFATAMAVLLRAANIPARYVEGYAVDCKAGTDVVVSRQNAHAWVEYYDWIARAWCVLEATPIYPKTERPFGVSGNPQEEKPDGWDDAPVEDTPVKDPTEEKPDEGDTPTEETETPTSQPEETVTPDLPQPQPEKHKWMIIVLGCLLLIPCTVLQGYVRILVKRRLWNRGRSNERTIWRWRLIRRDAKLLKQRLPEELDDLAQKARFSQHKIRPEELRRYEEYRLTLLAAVAKKPWYQRLFVKWILAIA
ncbi:MAG: transglutaminase domain-containing protein [Ruminococcaceae bacterium]|nr:transglutaminase domain-containing protein [Oscillospiraceae bacterium]